MITNKIGRRQNLGVAKRSQDTRTNLMLLAKWMGNCKNYSSNKGTYLYFQFSGLLTTAKSTVVLIQGKPQMLQLPRLLVLF
jgi:hypothetical protein